MQGRARSLSFCFPSFFYKALHPLTIFCCNIWHGISCIRPCHAAPPLADTDPCKCQSPSLQPLPKPFCLSFSMPPCILYTTSYVRTTLPHPPPNPLPEGEG